MRLRQALVVALVVALLVTAFRPAPAEAMDVMMALAIASAVIAVVILTAYLVIATVEHRRAEATRETGETPVLVVYAHPALVADAP